MPVPTAEELREIAEEIGDSIAIEKVEKFLMQENGKQLAQYYLHGYVQASMRSEDITPTQAEAYFRILELPEKDVERYRKSSTS